MALVFTCKREFGVVFIITVLGLCLADTTRIYAQSSNQSSEQKQDEDVIRVSTTLVTLPVQITDRHGKSVPGLTKEQFHVYEDGVEQEIAYFEPPANDSNSPATSSLQLTIALLLDVSDSTQFKLEQIKNTALAFLDLLRPTDQIVVVAFDKQVRVLTQATQDRNLLRAAIRGIKVGGGTSLYESLVATITLLNRTAGRKAIIVLTDGVDTSSTGVSWEMVLREVESSYVTIYPIQYHTLGDFAESSTRETYAAGEFGRTTHVTRAGESPSAAYQRGSRYLRLLADKTSGYFQYNDKASNLARSFERLASQLRQQYTIAYYPTNKAGDDATRKVTVKVTRPDLKVRTRKSYTNKSPNSLR